MPDIEAAIDNLVGWAVEARLGEEVLWRDSRVGSGSHRAILLEAKAAALESGSLTQEQIGNAEWAVRRKPDL